MRRREFISLIGGTAAAGWPLAVRAQQSERVRRIGVLMAFAESDPQAQAGITALRQQLNQFGWTDGRNIIIDQRLATGPDQMHGFVTIDRP